VNDYRGKLQVAYHRSIYVEQGGRCADCQYPKGLEDLILDGPGLVCELCLRRRRSEARSDEG
jgi:hypothetical protein